MREIIFEVEATAADEWTARNITESIVTVAETMEELRAKTREAVNWRFVRDNTPVMIKLRIITDKVRPCKSTYKNHFSL
jgi:hypothetical protein